MRAATRLHGDDTTVPLLARGGTKTARLWTYVRDGEPSRRHRFEQRWRRRTPFDGTAPPAVVFHFSRDRGGEHPPCWKHASGVTHLQGWQGILQADAYAGYNPLYDPGWQPGPVAAALCWSHARRKFFELADIETNVRKGKSAVCAVSAPLALGLRSAMWAGWACRMRGGEAHNELSGESRMCSL